MINQSPCVVVPFSRNGSPPHDVPLVFPDLCGRALDLTPTLKQTMAIAFAGFGIDIDGITTHSQLFTAGQHTLRNPHSFTPSLTFVRGEAARLNALGRLLSEIQYADTKDRVGMPARLRTEALRDIADGKPISPERYSRLIRLSRFDVITGTGGQVPPNGDTHHFQERNSNDC